MRLLLFFLMVSLCFKSWAVEIIQDEKRPWSIDSETLYNDTPTLKTGFVFDNESTSVQLTFSNVTFVEFYVKTSSESDCDKLTIDFDGTPYEYSGQLDWQCVYLDWGWEGEHTITLTYSKDSSVSSGEDCCWIWFDGVDTLNQASSSSKDWDNSKEHAWVLSYNTELNSDGKEVPYMMTPILEEGQEAWMSYAVEGVKTFPFKFVVSSEENSDCLIVTVDDEEVASFSGDKWWETYEIQLPDTERHIIKWAYRKDANGNNGGNDEAYVWFEGIENIMLDGYSMNLVYPWVKDSEVTWSGDSLRTGEIPDNERTSFSVIVPNGRQGFSYALKVSSEEDRDFLRIYVNDQLVNSISGEIDWSWSWLFVNPGDAIRFEYAKDDNGKASGSDCGWVWFDGIENFMSIMHLFPDDDTVTVEETQTIKFDLNTGRDVQREILDGDDGVSFATEEFPVWIHDENAGAMRSAEVARGGESWMSSAVIGKGTFSFRWKSSGETLSCYVDGELKETLTEATDWAQVDVALEDDARHEIKWVFARGEDSSDAEAAGWVDGIVWDAPEGWDDPDEPIVPHIVSTFIPFDTRQSPRVLDTTNFCERITYDPTWRNAASVVLSVNASEAVKTAESGVYEWKSEKEGLFGMKLEFLDSVGAAIGEPLTASFKIVLDPLPALGENATAEDVASILGGVADGKLKANIAGTEEYANFRAWLQAKGIDHNNVTKSLFAWLSYALDTAGLIAAEPKEGDLRIDGFGNGAEDGKFEIVASVDGISVGDGATDANLRKVFEVEGASAIMRSNGTDSVNGAGIPEESAEGTGFSADNVEVSVAEPLGGKVKFTVSPKGNDGQFFFRVKMK